MAIRNICKKEVITVNEDSSLMEVAEIMGKENVGFIIVKGESGSPTGVITDRDIVVQVIAKNKAPTDIKVKDVMSKDLLILGSHQGVHEIIKSMGEKGVRRAPIMEDNKIIGIVAIDDLIILLADEFCDIAQLLKKQINNSR